MDTAALDAYITGNWGEDSIDDTPEFPCTVDGCPEMVTIDAETTRHEYFDASYVLCDDCLRETIPDDVTYIRPATAEEISRMMDAALTGYDADGDLDLMGVVR